MRLTDIKPLAYLLSTICTLSYVFLLAHYYYFNSPLGPDIWISTVLTGLVFFVSFTVVYSVACLLKGHRS